MTVSVTTVGTGQFGDGSTTTNLADYSVSIGVSPILLGDYSGGSTTLSFTTKSDTSNSIANSSLLMDNKVTVNDDAYGSISGNVKALTMTSDGLVSASGDTIMGYLDIDVTMGPAAMLYCADYVTGATPGSFSGGSLYGGFSWGAQPIGAFYNGATAYASNKTTTPFTLKRAIDGYFAEVNYTHGTTVDYSGLSINPVVNFPAWSGNLLSNIKDLCAIYRIRFWASDSTYYFADISENVVDVSPYEVTQNISNNIKNPTIVVNNKDTKYNDLAQLNNIQYYHPDIITFAGDKIESIDIPTPGFQFLAIPADYYSYGFYSSTSAGFLNAYIYDPSNSQSSKPWGAYVMSDANGYDFIANSSDGSGITISTSNPYYYQSGAGSRVSRYDATVPDGYVRITFYPPLPYFQQTFPGPYSLSFIDATTGETRSSLYIGGLGIPVKDTQTTIVTGSVSANSNSILVDSPFIWDADTFGKASYYASAYYGKVDTSVSISAPISGAIFSNIDNLRFIYNNCKYKTSTATVDYGKVSLSAEPATTVNDFDTINGTKTIAQLDAKITGMTLGDWAIMPLVS
jgi:hypothetical protein